MVLLAPLNHYHHKHIYQDNYPDKWRKIKVYRNNLLISAR